MWAAGKQAVNIALGVSEHRLGVANARRDAPWYTHTYTQHTCYGTHTHKHTHTQCVYMHYGRERARKRKRKGRRINGMEGGREGEGEEGREKAISASRERYLYKIFFAAQSPPNPHPYSLPLSLYFSLSPPCPPSSCFCLSRSLPPSQRERVCLCAWVCLCLRHQMARRLIFPPAVLLFLGRTGELDPLPSAPMRVTSQRQRG